jgi:hypothetical protein
MTESKPQEPLRTYFWMVHYDISPVVPAGSLKPVAAGRKRGIAVFARNLYANHVFDFRMLRENEGAVADPSTYRGSPDFRNRILGFYSSQEEANAHIDGLWEHLQSNCGAIYAELHTLRLDVAQEIKLAA